MLYCWLFHSGTHALAHNPGGVDDRVDGSDRARTIAPSRARAYELERGHGSPQPAAA
jgi:hypothetical protein